MVQTFICSYKERAAVALSPAAWNLEATTVADFVSAWQWSCQNCRIVVRIAELLSESQNCCQNRRFFVLVAELLAELLSESQNCCQNRSIVVRITTLVGGRADSSAVSVCWHQEVFWRHGWDVARHDLVEMCQLLSLPAVMAGIICL